MRAAVVAGTFALFAACAGAPRAPLDASAAAMQRDVAWLASPRLEGRDAGTRGSDSAAAYVGRRFRELGLSGAFAGAYEQPFRVVGGHTRNVAALITGTEERLRGQVLVLGAHYDHVGRSVDRARDGAAGSVVRPGADDNASGTAALLELARRLAAAPTRRTVMLVAFGAEERGLVGSAHFVEQPPVALDSVIAMVNLDMVGRLRGATVIVIGRWTPALRALLDSASAVTGVRTAKRPLGVADSDHYPFAERGVPALHFFTGLHVDYHTAGDIAVRVDPRGMTRVVDLAERFVRAVADREDSVRERR